MMQQQEFIAKMAIAYMQHYGCDPSDSHIDDWAKLWKALTNKAR